ncbi:hypothetical protein Pelo_237 [Pelomyxa schiedti]|nr:hypothetical protein Pelo_237 [Pelomyxa schiedti]
MPSCATATSAASTTPHQVGTEANTTSTVRNLLFQSLSAVAHIERAHVIHRDIKGDNILVDPATHKLTLIDFGEAVECCSADDDDDSLQVMLTRADNGQVWGNTGTMPPEVSALSRDLMRMRGSSCMFSFAKGTTGSVLLLPLLQPSSSSPPPPPSTTTQPPQDNNTKNNEQNNAQPPTMAMKVLFNWEKTPQQTLIKQKYMKECIVLASVPLHPNVIHPLGTLVIPRFPPEFIEAIPSDQPVYKEFALNKSLAFLLPFCGVPLPKFLSNMPSCATATSAASTTPHQVGTEASTTSTVRNLLFQSLSAVAHIERAHVIHRDIKGDNILVDPATHKLTLIDFGEAVECCSAEDDDDDNSLQVMLTRADNGQVWGNTGTMPPEVSALSRDLMRMRGSSCMFSFAKCDSFSLALTFYDAMLPPTNKFIGKFKQDMCTFSTELLPPLPPQWNNNCTTATATTARPTGRVMGTIAQVLVGMMSRDRTTRLSASDALNSLHSI